SFGTLTLWAALIVPWARPAALRLLCHFWMSVVFNRCKVTSPGDGPICFTTNTICMWWGVSPKRVMSLAGTREAFSARPRRATKNSRFVRQLSLVVADWSKYAADGL